VHIPSDPTYQAQIPRSNSRYKSTVHVVTSTRDHQPSNAYRRRRPDSETNNPPPSSYNIVSYNRPQAQQPSSSSSRSYHQNYPISLASRATTSNRRSTIGDVPLSAASYSSLITLNNRPTIPNPPSSINQIDDTTRAVSIQGKRYTNDSNKSSTTDSTTLSNQLVFIPKSKSNQIIDKHHHSSCPVAYQNQISLGTITILSDSSSDNTILHHLPDHNETTDKSQQSLHDDRLNRSPRKANNNTIGSRLRSASSIDEQKKLSIPSIHYTIEPIHVNEDLNDENHFDLKQKAIREERKRKANENEQVLINVDEYASEILMYLKEREVQILFIYFSNHLSNLFYSIHHDQN
jgi:hypothetical protein